MDNAKKFPKGQVCLSVAFGVPAIVVQSPFGKHGARIELLEVFGVGHEYGSAWVADYKPCTLAEFDTAMHKFGWERVDRKYKGQLKGVES